MNILVNDIAASEGGAISVLNEFYNYVLKYDKKNTYVFLLGAPYLKETKNIKILVLDWVKKSNKNRVLFDLFKGKKLIKKICPDVILSLQNTKIFGVNSIPQVIYMHQSIPFQNIKKFSFFKRQERGLAIKQYLVGFFIKKSIVSVERVIVQTEWIRKAVIEKTGVSQEKVVRIFPSIQDHTRKIEENFDNSLFVYPAGSEIYKNHKCIYDAVDILKSKFDLDFRVVLTLDGENTKEIINVGKISHDEVMNYLSKGTLIFPSYIETVGLPMVEARLMGGLILASDCPFSREALDFYENAYFFDPFSPSELAELMYKIIQGKIDRKECSNKYISGTENSWEQIMKVVYDSTNIK